MSSIAQSGGTGDALETPRFLTSPTQFVSSPYITFFGRREEELSPGQSRYFFTMARYALYHGLRMFGVRPGDEVLVPSYICDAAVAAIQASGAAPVFFRIRRDCSIDIDDASSRISARTRALLVVHYFGFPQDLEPVCRLARQHGLILIEDCAHVISGEAQGVPLGRTGSFSIFSWRKFIPAFDGGELRLNVGDTLPPPPLQRNPLVFDLKALKYVAEMHLGKGQQNSGHRVPGIASRWLQRIRRTGARDQEPGKPDLLKLEVNNSSFELNIANSPMSRVSRYILNHSNLRAIIESRRKNYQDLAERISAISGVLPLFPGLAENNTPLHFPVYFDRLAGAHRLLRSRGIPATAWDGVRPAGVCDHSFPDAGCLYENLVFLPVHQNLAERDLDLISDAVKKVRIGHSDRTSSSASGSAGPSAHRVSPNATRSLTFSTRRILMVAFHFPPHMGSSGLLRTLKNARYLPDCGWMPTVLTANPRTYDSVDQSQLQEIPQQVRVIRAFALDTRKHLSFKGRYFRHAALPDRWSTWALGAVPAGALEIYKNKIDVILTTFPVASAVLIGYMLHRITHVPWIADFRDSMTEKDYPRDPHVRRAYRWLEKKAVQYASRLLFTAESTRQMYLQRYPDLSPDKCLVIANGYDEQDFVGLSRPGSVKSVRLRMQHSGLIYPEERNPVPFFKALSRLVKQGRIQPSSFRIELRACGNDEHFRRIVTELGIDQIVHFLPALPYRVALQDCSEADILLLLQGASCDHQIPAKAYEYLRMGKPILALTSETGDTAKLLRECGGSTILDIADEEALVRALPDFLDAVRNGSHSLPNLEIVSRYSRQNQARELANCLSGVIES